MWGDLVCYDFSQKRRYWNGPHSVSNEALFGYLQPVADFWWRHYFSPNQGSQLAGILLHEMLTEFNSTIATLSSREPSTRELLRSVSTDHDDDGVHPTSH